jgi:hypothetical protein
MRETEIKSISVLALPRAVNQWKGVYIPLVPFIGSSLKIVVLLLLCHHTPLLVAFVVPPHIVILSPNDECEVPRHEPEQNLVAAAVERLIIVSVDLCR